MAEIIITGYIGNVERINRYSSIDANLVESTKISNEFDVSKDYIEYHAFDGITDILLDSNYNYTGYKIPSQTSLNPDGSSPFIEIDPVSDLQSSFTTGDFKSVYNIFRHKISEGKTDLFVKEISDDRTEIRLGSTTLTNEQIYSEGVKLIDELNSATYSKDFLINFSENRLALAVNVALDTTGDNYTILFKLYEPLFDDIEVKSTVWVVEEITESYIFPVNLSSTVTVDPLPNLRGPNFSIKVPNQNNVSTEYESYSSIYTSLSGSLTGSSYNQISNALANTGADINIDYTDFNEFVRFGSAKKRTENFYNKVKTIEDYNNNIQIISATSSSVKSSEIAYYSSSISTIIDNFDGFEQYMYFESSSFAYPKTTSTKPFVLEPTSSVQTWYTSLLEVADDYDRENLDNLENVVPVYVKENSDNEPYMDFVHMVGHYFDNIWIYLKSVTDLYQSNNNLEQGVSKDLVYYALQSLGVNLYNSGGDSKLDEFFVGANSGSLSDLNNIPKKDLLAETYKRIYHNIPLLFKSKGTSRGIDQLVNIFGVTDEILSIKEYGGNRKNNTLIGNNTEKIRVIPTQITGSVLSPYIRLEENSLDISNVRSIDYHEVDISFSPQHKIDSVLSASIAAAVTGFEIDNYIGDPRLETSGSYPTLETLRKSHIDSSFSEEYDYAGFIELVKFFDNSLFKMLKDHTPGRSNMSTGVTIRPQHLERIKFKRLQPGVSTEHVHEAEFSGPVIAEDNDYLYSLLPSDRRAFYNGELSGSWPDINEDFELTNPNPFLKTTTSSSYQFEHTDFNVTLNNSFLGRPSTKVSKITPIYSYISGTLQQINHIQVQSDVQDSNESLKSFELSRHEGVKLTSATYNDYTEGDISFGKNAVIDNQVKKLGLFSEVVKSKFLPNRNDVVTKYLVDEEGNLTELNQRNKNWEEIQRTFPTNYYLDVSLFDNQKYSNQKNLDGTKLIFESGYSYTPLLYISSSDSTLYFQSEVGNTSRELEATHSIGLITSSLGTTPDYPLFTTGSDKTVFNVFTSLTKDINSSTYYHAGTLSPNTYPSYSVPESGLYNITASVGLEVTMSDGGNVTWSLEMVSGSTVISSDTEIVVILDQVEATTFTGGTVYYGDYQDYGNGTPEMSGETLTLQGSAYTLSTDVVTSGGTVIFAKGTTLYSYNVFDTVTLPTTNCVGYDCSGCGACNVTLSNSKTLWGLNSSITMWKDWGQCYATQPGPGGITTFCGYYSYYQYYQANSLYEIPNIYSVAESTSFTLNINTQQTLTAGEKYEFRIKQKNPPTGSYIAKFNTSGFLRIASISNQVNQLPSATSGSMGFVEEANYYSGSITSSIVLNQQLSSFVGYSFVPSPPTGSGLSLHSLYPTYGDVDYEFDPSFYDMIVHHNTSGQVSEYRIVNTRIVGNKLTLDISPAFDNSAKALSFRNDYTKVLFLKRRKDETNTIINFIKRDGKTSYGFIIPDNLHPDVFANIDTITREVKTKMIEGGGLDGGTL